MTSRDLLVVAWATWAAAGCGGGVVDPGHAGEGSTGTRDRDASTGTGDRDANPPAYSDAAGAAEDAGDLPDVHGAPPTYVVACEPYATAPAAGDASKALYFRMQSVASTGSAVTYALQSLRVLPERAVSLSDVVGDPVTVADAQRQPLLTGFSFAVLSPIVVPPEGNPTGAGEITITLATLGGFACVDVAGRAIAFLDGSIREPAPRSFNPNGGTIGQCAVRVLAEGARIPIFETEDFACP